MSLASKGGLVDQLIKKDPRAIAQAISAVENKTPEAAQILKSIFPHTGEAFIIGITGAPGSGKSTLVDRLIEIHRQNDQTVAVIAVDPTSPFSGGAILGDRIRMHAHSLDPGTYIRSMATRGHLGGLAQATNDTASILDAAGFDAIIIETVGVGQGEVEIAKSAHCTIVVLVPGMGDEVQAMKAGVMEIADLFVINKADREDVLRLERELLALLPLATRTDGWQPPVLKTVATQNIGVNELYEKIKSYKQFNSSSPEREAKAAMSVRERLLDLLKARLLEKTLDKTLEDQVLRNYIKKIVKKEKNPYSVVEEILGKIKF